MQLLMQLMNMGILLCIMPVSGDFKELQKYEKLFSLFTLYVVGV